MNIIETLKGKKTYILVVLGAIIFVAARLGYISADLEVQAYKALGIAGVATLRGAISSVQAVLPPVQG